MRGEVTIEDQAMNAENLTFGDDRLGVIFYIRTVEDTERSKAEGRKCFRDREYVKILIPGDRHNYIDRPVQRTGVLPTDDTLRFAQQYARFKAQAQQKEHDGTPLSLWPQISPSLAEELKYLNIFTVEQLAELADTYVAKVPMGHQWKAKAKEFVAAQKDASVINKLQSELAARDEKIAELAEAIKEQGKLLAEMGKKSK